MERGSQTYPNANFCSLMFSLFLLNFLLKLFCSFATYIVYITEIFPSPLYQLLTAPVHILLILEAPPPPRSLLAPVTPTPSPPRGFKWLCCKPI
jgi:hypothetical protein